MQSWLRAHRGFVALSLSTALVVASVAGAYALFGERLVRAAYEGRSFEVLNERYPGGRLPLAARQRQADGDFAMVVSVVLAAWAGASGVYLALRSRRRVLALAAFLLVWWLAVELLVAPHLVRPLRLIQYALMKDVDHRPTFTGAGYNSDSIRAAPEPSEFRPEDFNIVFLGDSFTYGFRVKGAQSFPEVVERSLRARHPDQRIEVANFGWTSSSPLLSWRRLVDIGDAYHPDLVVLCIDMTDFGDDIRFRNMFDRRGIYRFYDRIPITLKLLQRTAPGVYTWLVTATSNYPEGGRFFITERPLEETRPWFEPIVDSIAKIEAWCRERGAEFVLVLLPRSYQYDARESPRNHEAAHYEVLGPHSLAPFQYFDELRGEVDYPVLSLLEDFRETDVFPTCFEDDPHWNVAGHRVAGDAIARKLAPIVERLLSE